MKIYIQLRSNLAVHTNALVSFIQCTGKKVKGQCHLGQLNARHEGCLATILHLLTTQADENHRINFLMNFK